MQYLHIIYDQWRFNKLLMNIMTRTLISKGISGAQFSQKKKNPNVNAMLCELQCAQYMVLPAGALRYYKLGLREACIPF